MAGYFNYLGRIFTEKGAWYKLLLIAALQGITYFFSANTLIKPDAVNGTEVNLPGLVLNILVSVLVLGYCLQVYSAGMNNRQKLLPDIDFAGMLWTVVRFIPFVLVWLIYMGLLGAAAAVIVPSFMLNKAGITLFAIFYIIVFLLFVLTSPAMIALHVRQFSYKYLLNPLTPFRIFTKVALPIFLFGLLYLVMFFILLGILFLFGMLLGVSVSPEAQGSGYFVMVVLLVLYMYTYNAITFAYQHKVCDIVKTKLEDTEFFDDEYDVPAQNSLEDSEDEFSDCMRNKDDELDL